MEFDSKNNHVFEFFSSISYHYDACEVDPFFPSRSLLLFLPLYPSFFELHPHPKPFVNTIILVSTKSWGCILKKNNLVDFSLPTSFILPTLSFLV